MANNTIDLYKNYFFLDPDGTSALLPGGGEFWSQLMSGKPSDAGIQRLLGSEKGRLLAILPIEADWKNWEMHPAGDELLFMLQGSATFVLELSDGLKEIALNTGQMLAVPMGVWHTARQCKSGRMLAITAGAGTRHRPL